MWSLVCLEKLLCGLSSAANSSMSLEAGSPQLGKDLAASLTFLLSQESISRTRVRTPTVRFLPILRGSPKEGPKVIPPWLWEIPGLCCLAGLEKRETNVRMWGINNSRHQEPSLGELAKRLAKRFPLLLADPDSHSCFFSFCFPRGCCSAPEGDLITIPEERKEKFREPERPRQPQDIRPQQPQRPRTWQTSSGGTSSSRKR